MNKVLKILIKSKNPIYNILSSTDRYFLQFYQHPIYIISYHSVANDNWKYSIDLEIIKKQILYLKNHFDIISLFTLNKYLKNKKMITNQSVVITFDDGYKDVLKLKAFFKKHKIRPAIFVLSNNKYSNRKELNTRRNFLTLEDIRSLRKENWEIGCHSATHADLTVVSDIQLTHEIINAKKKLERKLGFSVLYFAYPSGKYNKKVINLVKKAKFELGLTMDVGAVNLRSDILALPRIGIDRTYCYKQFMNTLSPSVVKFRSFITKRFINKNTLEI